MRVRNATQSSSIPIRRHRPDFVIVLTMSVLMLLGLIVIYSISPALTARINANGSSLDQNHFMYRQVEYLLVGVVAFVLATLVPIERWRKYQGKLLIGALVLCLIPIVLKSSSLVLCTNGACRWINLGFVTLQPAEALKFALLIFLAGFIAARVKAGELNNVQETLVPIGLILALIAVIIVGLQKDLGTGISIFGIVMTMLFVAGLKSRYFLLALGAMLLGGLLFTVTSQHRIEQVATFVHGSNDQSSAGYHIRQALIAVGSGGIFGQGLGRSIQAFGYLPEAANDSIFAIVAEKFGFVGTLAILVIFGVLFVRLLRILARSRDGYYRLLMAGVFGWVFTHTIVNIGAMVGVFPLTGITLPFLSFGGTSLLFMAAALGLAFNISRYTSLQPIGEEESHEDRRGRRGFGRPHYAGARRTQ